MLPRDYRKFEKMVPDELQKAFNQNDLDSIKVINRLDFPFNFRMNVRGGWLSNNGSWFYPIITSQETAINHQLRNADGRGFLIRAFENGNCLQTLTQPNLTKFDTGNAQKILSFALDPKYAKDRNIYTKIKNIAKFYNVFIPNASKILRFEIKTPVYKNNRVVGYNIKRNQRLPFFIMEVDRLKDSV